MEEYERYSEYSHAKDEEPVREAKNMPQEWVTTADPCEEMQKEFGGKSGGRKEQQASGRLRLIKRVAFVPVAASVTAVTIVFSAMGYDPLGEDVFERDAYEQQDEPGQGTGDKDADHPRGQGDNNPEPRYAEIYEDAYACVTYVPTGETFTSSEMGKEGMDQAREWVKNVGGDPNSMTFLYKEEVYVGYELSDDAIPIGDVDDIDNMYLAQGTMTKIYKTYAYYEAYERGAQNGTSQENNGQGNWQDETGNSPYIIEGLPICVTYLPTGESYYPTESGKAGIDEAREWLTEIGGNPDSIEYVDFKREEKYEVNDGVLNHYIITYAYYEATD